jgi:hypothetical protein
MYSITENIYCSQLSSVAILLQPEPNCFTSYNTRKGLGSLSSCAITLRSSPPSHVSTCNGQRSSQLFCVHYTVCITTQLLQPACRQHRLVAKRYQQLSLTILRHLCSSVLCRLKYTGYWVLMCRYGSILWSTVCFSERIVCEMWFL